MSVPLRCLSVLGKVYSAFVQRTSIASSQTSLPLMSKFQLLHLEKRISEPLVSLDLEVVVYFCRPTHTPRSRSRFRLGRLLRRRPGPSAFRFQHAWVCPTSKAEMETLFGWRTNEICSDFLSVLISRTGECHTQKRRHPPHPPTHHGIITGSINVTSLYSHKGRV
jgi:hypothetical protein